MGVGLPLGSGEDVGGRYQLHVHEAGLIDGVQVFSFQESAADSSGPQFHHFLGGIRYRLLGPSVHQLQTATRFPFP